MTNISKLWKNLSFEIRSLILAVFVLCILLGAYVVSVLSTPEDICVLEFDTPYNLQYVGPPVSYKSDTDLVIWRPDGCGWNLENRYTAIPQVEGVEVCTVIKIHPTQSPEGVAFSLIMPKDRDKACPAKPLDMTPTAHR